MSHSNANRPLAPTQRRWRITFCITELDPGGAERQLVRIATGLDRDRFEPEVVCLASGGPLVEPLRAAGISVTCLDARGRWDAGVVLRLRRHLRRSRPDLVQTFLFHANIAGRVAARLARVPHVVSGIRVAEPRRWQLMLDRLTDRLVDRHICVSRAVADYSRRVGRLPGAKLEVIPNAVDASRYSEALPADLAEFGFPAGSKVILFVGRLDEQKDPGRLLEAFRQVHLRHSEARLLFVGQGPLESALRGRAADFGQQVAFAGRRNDLLRLLKAAACLALPSRWEGMPNVVLEAMAAGTPIVTSNFAGALELLDGGKLGSVVQENGTGAFASALENCLQGSPNVVAKAEAAQIIAREQYTTDAMLAAYRRSYLNLMERRFPDQP